MKKKDIFPFPGHAPLESRLAVAGETVDPPFLAMPRTHAKDRAAAL
jgi:hypothetical protein